MKTKMVYLTVAVEMDAEADEQEVIQECDYFFDSSAIKNTEIANHLALPPVKIHCSVLAEDAIAEYTSS